MKKTLLSSFFLLTVGYAMAGGILTNTNQSAMFTRLQARDAVIDLDAVYYNPAGLNFLPDNGLFVSLNNQTLGQTRTIKSDYMYLNDGNYQGKVSAPFFPGIYASYKLDKIVISLGFNPIGGGGGGIYEKGLPSFEYPVADLVPSLSSQGAQGYNLDAYFKGSSVYFGYQLNVSYKINDKLSVALGGRYVQAKESYSGYLKNIELNMGGTWMPASDVLNGIAAQANAGATAASSAAANMQPLITGGYGGLTFEQAQNNGIIDATTRAQLEGGLTTLGISPTGLTLAQAQGAYSGAATSLTATAAKSAATASILQDQEVEYEKTASGITPIFSINYKLNDQLNFAFKYEHKTELIFENSTKKDFTTGFTSDGTPVTQFPDGAKAHLDLPTQISIGATYRPVKSLLISTGYHTFLDKNANWNGKEQLLDGNSWEFAMGLEYTLTEKLLVSAGWLKTSTGATEAYQTDLSYSLPTNTLGGGFAYDINKMIELNLGGSYTMYQQGEKNFLHDIGGSGTMVPVKETYDKDVWIVSLGLNFRF
ncbi:OmpP1/FadL family transporter [Saccharicrinis sp. FJH54]|uniref:OmpP1/FadL family transporter n=1 Tax=Saccharicrinis sp. FJH54 TaxID=3344665 RepID=UPI0035D3F502